MPDYSRLPVATCLWPHPAGEAEENEEEEEEGGEGKEEPHRECTRIPIMSEKGPASSKI